METPSKIEIGCGYNKRKGFFGIDLFDGLQVDAVVNVEHQPLPFPDDSVEYVYSSHAFEHMRNFPFVFKEILRVCKHGATVELWTPYGKSNDGLLFGHDVYFTETSFKHVCFEYDRFYLGNMHGFFDWKRTEYNLVAGVMNKMAAAGIAIDFALEHMFNICTDWGVFLEVRKDAPKSVGAQYPIAVYSYGRGNFIDRDTPTWQEWQDAVRESSRTEEVDS